MVNYHRGITPKIFCESDAFVVKIEDEELGRWPDIRQAKAARWAARSALELRTTDETLLDLVDYAASYESLWMTFDEDLDEDCVDLREFGA